MQSLVSRVPIMVVEGNHEIELQAGNKTFEAYSSRFAFPSEESGSPSTFYYSFNAGGVHFIMLGGYINYDKTGIFLFYPYSPFSYMPCIDLFIFGLLLISIVFVGNGFVSLV